MKLTTTLAVVCTIIFSVVRENGGQTSSSSIIIGSPTATYSIVLNGVSYRLAYGQNGQILINNMPYTVRRGQLNIININGVNLSLSVDQSGQLQSINGYNLSNNMGTGGSNINLGQQTINLVVNGQKYTVSIGQGEIAIDGKKISGAPGTSQIVSLNGQHLSVMFSQTGQIFINGQQISGQGIIGSDAITIGSNKVEYKIFINQKPVSIVSDENGGVTVNGVQVNPKPGQEQKMNLNGEIISFTFGPNREIIINGQQVISNNQTIITSQQIYTIFINAKPATISILNNQQISINGKPVNIPAGQTITTIINAQQVTIRIGSNNEIIINNQPITNGMIVTINSSPTFTINFHGKPVTVTPGNLGTYTVTINGVLYTVPKDQIIIIEINNQPATLAIGNNGEIIINNQTVVQNGQTITLTPIPGGTEFTIYINNSPVSLIIDGRGRLFINGVILFISPGQEAQINVNGANITITIQQNGWVFINGQPVLGQNKEIATIVLEWTIFVNGQQVQVKPWKGGQIMFNGDVLSILPGQQINYNLKPDNLKLIITLGQYLSILVNGQVLTGISGQNVYVPVGGTEYNINIRGKAVPLLIDRNGRLFVNGQFVSVSKGHEVEINMNGEKILLQLLQDGRVYVNGQMVSGPQG